MATSLRLLRTGTTRRPCYRLVVIDKARANKGAVIENLGDVHLLDKAEKNNVKADRVAYWMSQGVDTSVTAKNFLKRAGLLAAVKA